MEELCVIFKYFCEIYWNIQGAIWRTKEGVIVKMTCYSAEYTGIKAASEIEEIEMAQL
jgi:hypothetical protein